MNNILDEDRLKIINIFYKINPLTPTLKKKMELSGYSFIDNTIKLTSSNITSKLKNLSIILKDNSSYQVHSIGYRYINKESHKLLNVILTYTTININDFTQFFKHKNTYKCILKNDNFKEELRDFYEENKEITINQELLLKYFQENKRSRILSMNSNSCSKLLKTNSITLEHNNFNFVNGEVIIISDAYNSDIKYQCLVRIIKGKTICYKISK